METMRNSHKQPIEDILEWSRLQKIREAAFWREIFTQFGVPSSASAGNGIDILPGAGSSPDEEGVHFDDRAFSSEGQEGTP